MPGDTPNPVTGPDLKTVWGVLVGPAGVQKRTQNPLYMFRGIEPEITSYKGLVFQHRVVYSKDGGEVITVGFIEDECHGEVADGWQGEVVIWGPSTFTHRTNVDPKDGPCRVVCPIE